MAQIGMIRMKNGLVYELTKPWPHSQYKEHARVGAMFLTRFDPSSPCPDSLEIFAKPTKDRLFDKAGVVPCVQVRLSEVLEICYMYPLDEAAERLRVLSLDALADDEEDAKKRHEALAQAEGGEGGEAGVGEGTESEEEGTEEEGTEDGAGEDDEAADDDGTNGAGDEDADQVGPS